MKAMAWALIIAALLMHFAFCEWKSRSVLKESLVIPPYIHARHYSTEYRPGSTIGRVQFDRQHRHYNTTAAALLGIALPVLLGGGGVALLKREKSAGDKK